MAECVLINECRLSCLPFFFNVRLSLDSNSLFENCALYLWFPRLPRSLILISTLDWTSFVQLGWLLIFRQFSISPSLMSAIEKDEKGIAHLIAVPFIQYCQLIICPSQVSMQQKCVNQGMHLPLCLPLSSRPGHLLHHFNVRLMLMLFIYTLKHAKQCSFVALVLFVVCKSLCVLLLSVLYSRSRSTCMTEVFLCEPISLVVSLGLTMPNDSSFRCRCSRCS